ncbi:energy transducer TonB [Acidovorax cavernicola]|nr:energy transducer TonB [Acidovorax cavernicola]
MKTPRPVPRCALLAGALTAMLLTACAAPPAPGEWTPQPPNPNAPYPAESRTNGEQGTVLLRVRTTPDGLPASVEVKQSSGHARLDRSALETVRKWRFKPTPDDGTVVWREVPIRFFITSPPQQPTMN